MRFSWSNIAESSAHWEQAFSIDGGKTWETNWRMVMTKKGETTVRPHSAGTWTLTPVLLTARNGRVSAH